MLGPGRNDDAAGRVDEGRAPGNLQLHAPVQRVQNLRIAMRVRGMLAAVAAHRATGLQERTNL
ncbi:hypothetical protein SDC9_197427 [bioreactor metagenome]|uniref:Uncharacterized protein n=1 Tax=bioreactor metagenome TaxID=1076179 RepID=A0A645IEV1_9ZZZZ